MKKYFNPHTNSGYWHVFRTKVDICWYGVCQCGFIYRCSKFNLKEDSLFSQELKTLYRFCPRCGKKYNTKKYVSYLDSQIPVELWHDTTKTYMDLIKYCHEKHNKGEIINAT